MKRLLIPFLAMALIHSTPSPSGGSLPEARRLLREGEIAGAIGLLQRIIGEEPENIDSHRLYMDLMSEEGRVDEIEEYYRKLLEKKGDSALCHYLYGRVLLLSGSGEAEGEFREAIRISPGFVWGYLGLGHLYVEKGDFFTAISIYEEGLTRVPDSHEIYFNLGNLYIDLKIFRKARECLEKSLKIKPDNPEVRASLAKLFLFEGNLEEAVKNIDEAMKAGPENRLVAQVKIEILIAQGKASQGLKLLEEGRKKGLRFSGAFIESVEESARKEGEKDKKREEEEDEEEEEGRGGGCSCRRSPPP